jgi:predicted ATP-grasp superfamily ATP-dependent carboligase
MTVSRTVIVTDGEQRAALAVVRSLGRNGFRCVTTSASGVSLAGASRYSARDVAVPNALQAPDDFSSAVTALAHEERAALLIPVTEPSMLALLRVRRQLAPTLIPVADLDVFRRVSDKALLLDAAAALGIAVPGQTVVRDRADAERLDMSEIRFPLVVKPARSVGEHAGRRMSFGVRHVASIAELAEQLAALPEAAYPLLLQHRVVGAGIGIFLLRWDDKIIASFAHRRLREKPPSGGVSVYRESVVAPMALMDQSRRLLEQFGWRGVAMIEYKQDATSGIPYLMEINGRFWGSLQLAVDAGVDFPRLLAACALNEPIEPVTDYPHVRSRWWWGEVDHLLTRLRWTSAELHLAQDAPSLARTLLDFFGSPLRPRDREEVFRPTDPLPFLRESRQWMRQL